MSAEPALLSAIRDRPDDDTPRLAYADWLDDAGDPAHAEFVRVQVALARTPAHDPARPALEDREHALLAAHEPAWLGVRPDALVEWEWERGFVDEVACGAATLLDLGPDLFARHPVRRWRASVFGEADAAGLVVVDGSWGDRLEALDLGWAAGTAAELGRVLPRCQFPRLRDLTLTDLDGVDPAAAVRLLGAFPPRAGLERLRVLAQYQPGAIDLRELAALLRGARLAELAVPGVSLAARDLTAFLAADCAAPLVRLDVSDSHLGPNAVPAFARPAPALAALDVSGTPLAAFALDPLLRSPALAGLRELNLNRCGSAANVVPALLRSPFWRQAEALRLADGTVPTRLIEPLFAADGPPALRTLDLSNNFLYDAGVADLCAASWAGSLSWLGLGRNYLTDDAAERICRSGRFRHLRTLHLSYNHPRWQDESEFAGEITDRGAVALATSPGLANLRVLMLTGDSLTAAGVDALINGPFWRLAGLGLGRCELTPAAVKVLAASPRLARLSLLDLSGNRDLRGNALRPLAESPHLSPLLELDVHGCGASDGVREELRRRLGRRLGA